jgi:membrane protease YdiL (CAAX protease family)
LAKRPIDFLRSVLPADPYQLLFLAGVVCLSTLRGLRWWRVSLHITPDRVASSFGRFIVNAGGAFMLPVIFAVAAGYFVCFWPGERPIRRILALVVFPSVLTTVLTLGRFTYLAGPPSSILQSAGTTAVGKLKWSQTITLGSLGLQVAMIGLLLITLFVLRLVFRASNLPLTLSGTRAEDSNEASSWRRVLMLIFFLIALDSVIGRFLLSLVVVSFPVLVGKPWFLGATLNAASLCTVAIALLIVDREARKIIRESIAVPKYKWTGFALFFPIAVDILLAIAQRSVDRFPWSPRIVSDLSDESSPRSFVTMFLVLILPALFEEVLFRGLLQKWFVRRYGLYRGIFLVCIVWAAFHIYSDFSHPHHSYLQIFERLGGRVLMILSVGFVLSWLTLKSRTIVPATLCHALYNALVFAPPGLVFAGMGYLRTTVWGAAAIILFRYWPVPAEPSMETMSLEDASPQSGSPQPGDDAQPVTA